MPINLVSVLSFKVLFLFLFSMYIFRFSLYHTLLSSNLPVNMCAMHILLDYIILAHRFAAIWMKCHLNVSDNPFHNFPLFKDSSFFPYCCLLLWIVKPRRCCVFSKLSKCIPTKMTFWPIYIYNLVLSIVASMVLDWWWEGFRVRYILFWIFNGKFQQSTIKIPRGKFNDY